MERGRTVTALERFARTVRWLTIAPLAVVALFVIWPSVALLSRGLTVDALGDLFGASTMRDTLWFTLWQAAVSTLATLAIGLPAAGLLARLEFRGRNLVRAVTLVPFVLPTLVVGLAMTAVLPGSLDTGVVPLIMAHVFLNIAVVVRIVGPHWESLPDTYGDAASTLGASPVQRFVTVTWPLTRSSVVAAGGIVFLFCFTTYGAARVLAGPQHPVSETEIYRYAVLVGDLPRASALAVAQLVLVGSVLLLTTRRSERTAHSVQRRRLRELRRSSRVAAVTFAAVLVVLVCLPIVGMMLRSFRPAEEFSLASWRAAFADSPAGANALDALVASLRIAFVATVVAIALGLTLAMTEAYAPGSSLRRVAGGLAATPVMISAVVLGLGFILAFRTAPTDWRGSWWLLPIAHAMVALPLVSRTLSPALQSIPNGYREAATLLGASPRRVWLDIDWALLRRPIAAAASLSATISLGEFGASSLLSRRGNETMTMAMGRLIGRPGEVTQGQVFVLATVLAGLCVALTVAADSIAGDKTTPWKRARR
jgi:thiamine transport system permease protein